MQYSSTNRLNDVIHGLRCLENALFDMSHEEICTSIKEFRKELGSILEED